MIAKALAKPYTRAESIDQLQANIRCQAEYRQHYPPYPAAGLSQAFPNPLVLQSTGGKKTISD